MTNERHILGLSCGKDSSALALFMNKEYPHLDIEYYFSDTGAELQETYEYLDRLEAILGKPISRITYQDKKFDDWLEVYNGFLPSFRARWCTKQLKIKAFEQWLQETSNEDVTEVYSYIGIRYDERERDGYKPGKNGMLVGDKSKKQKAQIIPVFPFIKHEIDRAKMFSILSDSGLDLPAYYEWRSRSGCYFCFYQRKIEWVGLKDRHPELFEKAKAYEEKFNYQWRSDSSLLEIEADAEGIKSRHEKRLRMIEHKKKVVTLFDIEAVLRGEEVLSRKEINSMSASERSEYRATIDQDDASEFDGETICRDCHS